MEKSVKLYTLNYDEVKTYLWAAFFVACNMALPQVCHLIPQGGIILAPLSLVILAGAYKLGWKVGLLAAVASPLVNHLVFGLPAWGMLQVMTLKLVALALVAGLTAKHFKKTTLPLLIGVVLVLFGIGKTVWSKDYVSGIWPTGIGTVLTVLCLLLCCAWNHTAYYPSTADLQSSLTLVNSCSSEFTLRTMFYVSLLVPFVLAYIIYAWRAIDKKKITKEELQGDDHAY